jgi:microcystin-dependent protein
MSEPFLGEILMFGGNFAPRGYAFCDGQLLSIAQNTALFALVGTTYGGNGTITYALPDLRGRVPVHQGSGPGLAPVSMGQTGGAETVTLTQNQMPPHSHQANGSVLGSQVSPNGAFWSTDPSGGTGAYSTANPDATMASDAITMAGGSQPHENRQPYLVINYIIALQGVFPSQS